VRRHSDDGVTDCVPVTAELEGEIVNAASVVAHLERDPPGRPIAQHYAGGRDAGVFFGPRAHRTQRLGALPAAFVPDESGRPPQTRQVDQLDRCAVLQLGQHATVGTSGALTLGLDVDAQHVIGPAVHAETPDIGQSDQ